MKNILYIMMALALVLTTSCEDFIDNPPEDRISVDDFFTTANDVENYVKKFYPTLPAHGSANLPLSEDNSDNLITAVPNQILDGTRAPANGSWNPPANNSTGFSNNGNFWDEIRAINILFDNIDQVTDGFEAYRHHLGEAHFFRAWYYFSLLNTFGDVPIYTTELLPGSEELLRPRDSRTEVADFILSELDKAIEYLDPRSVVNNSTINKEAALAFKTRVALFEGTWQKYHAGTVFGTSGANPAGYFQQAVDAAQTLIDAGIGLYNTGNPEQDYYTLFGLDDMSAVDEVLFYRVAKTSEQLGHELQFYTTRRTRNMSLTWSLITSYLDKNGAPYDYAGLAATTKGNAFLTQIAIDCDPRLHATVWIPGDLRVAGSGDLFDKPFIDGGSEELAATGFQVKKFSNPFSPAAGADFGGLSETGYIYFRMGEVLLNYAEALYELNETVAQAELDRLRARVGMPAFSIIPQAEYKDNLVDYGYAVDDALYAIRNERRVELALEGQRVGDYRRWAAHALFQGKRPLGYPFDQAEFPGFSTPVNEGGLVDYFQSQLPNGYGFQENRDYLSSIPQDELVLNPNLTQNPNW